MGWAIDGSMAFGAFAAAAQLAIGVVLLFRNPRNERVALVGLLFVLNGVITALHVALTSLVMSPGPGEAPALSAALRRTSVFFDFATNLLILLLALLYPLRPRWLQKAPHGVLIFGAAVLVWFAVRVWLGDPVYRWRSEQFTLSGPAVLAAYGLFDLAFPILVVRWAWLWRGELSPGLRAQFGLVFAAFAVRAFHQMIKAPASEIIEIMDGRETTTAGIVLGAALVVVIAAAGAASLGLMVSAGRRMGGRDKMWHWFVLSFIGFGILEGIMATAFRPVVGWWDPLTGQFDMLVIRPVLLWFAVTRNQFLDVRFRSNAFAWSVAFVLTAAAVMGGMYQVFGGRGPMAVQWALSALLGVVAGTLLVASAKAIAPAARAPPSTGPTALELYAGELDEAYRNGWPSVATRTRLVGLRAQLGIDDALHALLEARHLAQARKAAATTHN